MKTSLKWYFLRWLCGFGSAVNGMVVILTLGFYSPGIDLLTTRMFLDETDRVNFPAIFG